MTTRRQFLKYLGSLGIASAGTGAIFDLQKIAAAASLNTSFGKAAGEDYRALVLLFMFGGNDANNLVIPTSAGEYTAYATGRTPVLALPQATLLPLTVQNAPGRTFGLHPAMAGLQGLFNQGKAGIVANVGPLLGPLTKAQYRGRLAPIPPDLFSHSDQQAQWQSSISDGSPRTGWGGRLGDLIAAANGANRSSTLISVTGNNLFEVGTGMTSFKVSPGNHFGFDFYNATGTDPLSMGITNMLALNNTSLFENAWKDIIARAIENQRILSQALAAVPPFTTVFPNNGLAQQFQMIARLLAVRQPLGLKRQVFFASIGGFDTHGESQLQDQNQLLGEISGALTAFYNATVELGVADQVTSFTASDFNRTFRSNGKGSDHAWGSHHLVVGGGVDGGKIFGQFPTIAIDGPDDDGGGHFIPTTSVDQYSATLAKWFGVSTADMPTIFSNLGRFATPDIGIMKPV
jgi:uncharacterized protein (DUF1501 family)